MCDAGMDGDMWERGSDSGLPVGSRQGELERELGMKGSRTVAAGCGRDVELENGIIQRYLKGTGSALLNWVAEKILRNKND